MGAFSIRPQIPVLFLGVLCYSGRPMLQLYCLFYTSFLSVSLEDRAWHRMAVQPLLHKYNKKYIDSSSSVNQINDSLVVPNKKASVK